MSSALKKSICVAIAELLGRGRGASAIFNISKLLQSCGTKREGGGGGRGVRKQQLKSGVKLHNKRTFEKILFARLCEFHFILIQL